MELDLCLGLPNHINLSMASFAGEFGGKSDSAGCGRQSLLDLNFTSEFENLNQQCASNQECCQTSFDAVRSEAKSSPLLCEESSFRSEIVRWPLVKSCMSFPQPSCNSDQSVRRETSSYVKVNMEGVAIGRKIDLNMHDEYQTLLQTLEFMFEIDLESINLQQSNGAREVGRRPGYALTYEDKDGDWMLVGDVPWQVFVRSVKRLRIRSSNL